MSIPSKISSALEGLSAHEIHKMQQVVSPQLNLKTIESWSDTDVAYAWGRAFDVPFVPIDEECVDKAAYNEFYRYCSIDLWLPLMMGREVACIACSRPQNPSLRRSIMKVLRREVYYVGADAQDINRVFTSLGEPDILSLKPPPPILVPTRWALISEINETNAGDPERNMVLEVIETAFKFGASDVFLDINKELDRIDIRCRISGICEIFPPIPSDKKNTFLTALKHTLKIDPNESYRSWDGRGAITLKDSTVVEIRAATIPIENGESISLRLADARRVLGNNNFSLPGERGALFIDRVIKGIGGLILVTGPTGSGKTTTLYGALEKIDSADHVIRSLEDPVEITVPGILATCVKDDISFPSGLKTFMRMNPEYIVLGEIRDSEVAQMALTAALTGHGIYATLHAIDGASTISRLLNMGLKQREIANILRVILSQRLVPRLCNKCKAPYTPNIYEKEQFTRFKVPVPEQIFKKRGCPECGSGYRGRKVVFELIDVNDTLKEVIEDKDGFSERKFRKEFVAHGGTLLGKDALESVALGDCEFNLSIEHCLSHPPPED